MPLPQSAVTMRQAVAAYLPERKTDVLANRIALHGLYGIREENLRTLSHIFQNIIAHLLRHLLCVENHF